VVTTKLRTKKIFYPEIFSFFLRFGGFDLKFVRAATEEDVSFFCKIKKRGNWFGYKISSQERCNQHSQLSGPMIIRRGKQQYFVQGFHQQRNTGVTFFSEELAFVGDGETHVEVDALSQKPFYPDRWIDAL